KRMLGVYVQGERQDVTLRLPLLLEKAVYHKLHWTLGRQEDYDGQPFLERLKPHIFAGKIPVISALLQIDQHDWAVRNTQTIDEHRYSLDVPAWGDRAPELI